MAAVAAVPDESLDLDHFHAESSRGQSYCIAGLLAVTPYFTALGVYADELGTPCLPALDRSDDTLDLLFGAFDEEPDSSYRHLCAMYGHSPWDDYLLNGKPASHKQLALARLRHALSLLDSDPRST